MAGYGSQNVRKGVEESKRQDAEDGAVAEVFQLAANDGIVGAGQVGGEDDGASQVKDHFIAHHDAIEHPAQFQEGRPNSI